MAVKIDSISRFSMWTWITYATYAAVAVAYIYLTTIYAQILATLAFSVHLGWSIALASAIDSLFAMKEHRSNIRLLITLSMVGIFTFIVGSFGALFLSTSNQLWGFAIASMVIAIVVFLFVMWIVAGEFCRLGRDEVAVPFHARIGAFFLLIYVLLGAPFVLARLKRMAGIPGELSSSDSRFRGRDTDPPTDDNPTKRAR